MALPPPRLRTDVALQPDGDGAFLLDPVSGNYYELNHTGLRVWQLLAEGRTPEAVAGVLSTEFRIDEPAALEEVTAWIGRLRDESLLVGSPRRGLRAWLRRWRSR
jgi:hypothetical protein